MKPELRQKAPASAASTGAYVFLDRDGTLVADPGYVHRLEDYSLLPGVVEGLRILLQGGFRLAIITNQSGLARGYFDLAAFERFQNRLLSDLAAREIQIDATYFCPHGPDEGCGCRKPEIGLLERAQRELGAELRRSWVVGDAERDVELARRAGCQAVRVTHPLRLEAATHGPERLEGRWARSPAPTSQIELPPTTAPEARDLYQAALVILRSEGIASSA